MPITPTYPGVYIEEIPSGVRTITGVATSITAFIGRALRGPVDEPITINNYGDFDRIFGGLWIDSTMSFAVQDIYQNSGSKAIIVRLYEKEAEKPDGKDIWKDDTLSTPVDDSKKASDGERLNQDNFIGTGKQASKEGLYALEKADLFNLLCIPPYKSNNNIDSDLIGIAAMYCENHRAMLLVDPPSEWKNKEKAIAEIDNINKSKNAALFFPRLKQRNPLRDNQMEEFAPCGAVAGIFARTDTQRGVWKALAGNEATLVGVPELSVMLTDDDNGELNPLGINCLRSRPAVGRVVWGSRTLKGDDRLSSDKIPAHCS